MEYMTHMHKMVVFIDGHLKGYPQPRRLPGIAKPQAAFFVTSILFLEVVYDRRGYLIRGDSRR